MLHRVILYNTTTTAGQPVGNLIHDKPREVTNKLLCRLLLQQQLPQLLLRLRRRRGCDDDDNDDDLYQYQ